MIGEVLRSIENVSIYAVIALIIFVTSFVLVIIAVWRMNKKQVHHASRLPLDDAIPGDKESEGDEPEDRKTGE